MNSDLKASRVTVLLVSSDWWPAKGGVSAFNLELALSLARIGHDVRCVVRDATAEERRHAAQHRINLYCSADYGLGIDAAFDVPFKADIVVGHDRWTGPAAARWHARHIGSRLAIILHVDPSLIDGLKTDESIEQRAGRLEDTLQQVRNADATFAVGPLLAQRWTSKTASAVHRLNPGLPRALPAVVRCRTDEPTVLLIGRAEDAELKGVFVAAKAMNQSASTATRNLEFIVRGVAEGTQGSFQHAVQEHYSRSHRFHALPFSASREVIANDLSTAWLLLQPSLEEGFGLVALEGLASGTQHW